MPGRMPEQCVWQALKQRCLNPRSRDFRSYGGRGITVCERWRTSFANFLADMGPRPSPLHSIDRIDNDAGYEPGNCRWATRAEQMRNTRRAHVVTTSRAVEELPRPIRLVEVGWKMTPERVREMREARAAGAAVTDLAKRYDISRGLASEICAGKKWRHIPGPVVSSVVTQAPRRDAGVSRLPNRCALCGERGHNRRTCGRLAQALTRITAGEFAELLKGAA